MSNVHDAVCASVRAAGSGVYPVESSPGTIGPTVHATVTGLASVTVPAVNVLVPLVLVALNRPNVTPTARAMTAPTLAMEPAARNRRFLLIIFLSLSLVLCVAWKRPGK